MKKIFKLAVVLGLTSASGLAYSAGDPIAERKAMMKNVGASAGAAAAMIKGNTPFDPRVALLAFRTMNAVSLGYGSKFPAGAESGGESKAGPKIWEDPDGFAAAVAKLQADTAAAIAAPATDLDAFKAQFAQVASNCSSCHETYRINTK